MTQPPVSDIVLGTFVTHRTHPEWGLGKVIHLTPPHVFVYFKDVQGAPADAVKQFIRPTPLLDLAGVQGDFVLDNLPSLTKNGALVVPAALRLTAQQAIDAFVRRYRHFNDSAYLEHERNYKWEAHCLCVREFLSPNGRQLLDRPPSAEVAQLLGRMLHATNLLSRNELIALGDALKDTSAALAMALACLRFVDQCNASTFDDLVEAVEDLPVKPGGSRVLSWPVVSLLPFLADPTSHMFLKPQQTKKTAQSFMYELLYDAKPNWGTYQRLLQLSHKILADIGPLGARDMIDVQSFMWVVNGAPYMQAP